VVAAALALASVAVAAFVNVVAAVKYFKLKTPEN